MIKIKCLRAIVIPLIFGTMLNAGGEGQEVSEPSVALRETEAKRARSIIAALDKIALPDNGRIELIRLAAIEVESALHRVNRKIDKTHQKVSHMEQCDHTVDLPAVEKAFRLREYRQQLIKMAEKIIAYDRELNQLIPDLKAKISFLNQHKDALSFREQEWVENYTKCGVFGDLACGSFLSANEEIAVAQKIIACEHRLKKELVRLRVAVACCQILEDRTQSPFFGHIMPIINRIPRWGWPLGMCAAVAGIYWIVHKCAQEPDHTADAAKPIQEKRLMKDIPHKKEKVVAKK